MKNWILKIGITCNSPKDEQLHSTILRKKGNLLRRLPNDVKISAGILNILHLDYKGRK